METSGLDTTKTKPQRKYDLEDRSFEFARNVRTFVRQIPRTIANIEDSKQVIRSSGSIGANYIEANEAIGKKDFLMRIRICRKEAKETRYWLRLIEITDNPTLEKYRVQLIGEAAELMNIFGAILRKTE
jgi:four helix bundle protein